LIYSYIYISKNY